MSRVTFLRFTFLFVVIITSAFAIYSVLYSEHSYPSVSPAIEEKFDETLLIINSCSQLDSLVIEKFRKSNYDTAATVLFIDSFLRSRFYHSYSELKFQDNWIAYLFGKFSWSHFIYPVRPCDIIKYPMAACSQQGILFQEQLHHLNIPCSTIEFFSETKKKPGHYAVSVFYSNSWHYFDSNREPYIIDSTMPSIEIIIDKKLYEKMYSKPSNVEFQEFFKNKRYKQVNNLPFNKGKMYYFQSITAFLSNWLWLFLVLAYLLYFLKTRSK